MRGPERGQLDCGEEDVGPDGKDGRKRQEAEKPRGRRRASDSHLSLAELENIIFATSSFVSNTHLPVISLSICRHGKWATNDQLNHRVIEEGLSH